MERLAKLSFVPALLFVALSGDAFASPTTASANHCRPVTSGTYTYGTVGIANLGTNNMTVACPIPMDATALGSTVSFRMRVTDNSTVGGFSCTPYVFTQDGSQLAAGAAKTTTGPQTGGVTFSSWTVSVPGNVNTNMYSIRCSIPGNFSVINTARAE